MPHIRIALSQFRPTKGEYQENVARIGGVISQAAQLDPKPELIVFPETATSGYFVEGGVKELAVTAGTLARDLTAAYQGPTIDVAVGFYERFQNHIHNSALYVTLGKPKPEVRHVHRKVFLPTYGVFDEERFVDRGQDGVRSFETGWGGKAAILICEDAWHSLAATVAALEGAQLIIVPSASPARGLGERDEHAVLLGDAAHDPLPAHDGRRQRRGARRVRRAREPRRIRGRQGISRCVGGHRSDWKSHCAGAAVRRGAAHRRHRSRRADDGAVRFAVAGGLAERAPGSDQEPEWSEAERKGEVRSRHERRRQRRTPHAARHGGGHGKSGRGRRPAGDRSRADAQVAGEFFEGRGRPPPQFQEGNRRPVGRRRFRADGVSCG